MLALLPTGVAQGAGGEKQPKAESADTRAKREQNEAWRTLNKLGGQKKQLEDRTTQLEEDLATARADSAEVAKQLEEAKWEYNLKAQAFLAVVGDRTPAKTRTMEDVSEHGGGKAARRS